jgi:hypothetical protein
MEARFTYVKAAPGVFKAVLGWARISTNAD